MQGLFVGGLFSSGTAAAGTDALPTDLANVVLLATWSVEVAAVLFAFPEDTGDHRAAGGSSAAAASDEELADPEELIEPDPIVTHIVIDVGSR